MNLLGPETHWAFISGSDEERFLDDISFSLSCLQHRSFPLDRIHLFLDRPSGTDFVSTYGFDSNLKIEPTSRFRDFVLRHGTARIVVVVTGHGSAAGISATPSIGPHKLLSDISSSVDVKNALIVLGQCYAGTFNYIEARRTNQAGEVVFPEYCILGSTDLHSSVSSPVDLANITTGPFGSMPCKQAWVANLFLFGFMYWIAVPEDIDGDGTLTAADAYKFAGIVSNQIFNELKKRRLSEVFRILTAQAVSGPATSASAQKLTEKARDDLLDTLNLIFIDQTPWVLNANLARRMNF